jgi:hypothetical protein
MGSEKSSPQIFYDFLFIKIFQTFHMAIQPSKLIIALLALAIISLTGWIMDFSNTVVVGPNGNTELQIYITNPNLLPRFLEQNKEIGNCCGVFSTLWQFSTTNFHDVLNSFFAFNLTTLASTITNFFKTINWLIRYHFFYFIIFFVIKLVVISIAGGAICRIAALQFARGEKPGLIESLRFSIKKFRSFFTAPLVPACIIIFIGLFIFILGLIGNIPRLGELIIGISMPLVLIAGIPLAIISIGATAGLNLMFPAIAYDGADCLDAINRSFSYVYAKPWQMAFYTTIATIYGVVCYIFIRFFAFLLLWICYTFLQLGIWTNDDRGINKLAAIWPEPSFMNFYLLQIQPSGWSLSIAAFLIHLSLLLVVGFVCAFIICFYFSANTIIYSLLRNMVDNTALTDMSLDLNPENE